MDFTFDNKEEFEKFCQNNLSSSLGNYDFPIPKKFEKSKYNFIHVFIYEMTCRGNYHMIRFIESDNDIETDEAILFFASILPQVHDLYNHIGDSSPEALANYLGFVADIDTNKALYIDVMEVLYYVVIRVEDIS